MTDAESKLLAFQLKQGFSFNNQDMLKQALTHSSYAKKGREKGAQDNERLEFFGDAVLKLIVSEYLFSTYPTLSEGPLTKKRAQIVSDKFLSEMAIRMDLGSVLFLSDAERQAGGAGRSSILANALEALLGAYYLDSGYEAVKTFFLIQIEACFHTSEVDLKDYKTTLQEYMQKQCLPLPEYLIVQMEGPEHQKIFYVDVVVKIDSKLLRRKGRGSSKKEAEQAAAKRLLEIIDKKE